MLRFTGALLLGALLATPLAAQPTPQTNQQQVYNSFTQTARTPDISVSSSSTPTALGAKAPVALVFNTGTVYAYVKLNVGTTTVTAAAGVPVPPGSCVALNATNQTYIAAITASGTTTLQVSMGSGFPGSCGGASGGGGGGGGGTSSNFGAAFPNAGTAAGFTDDTNMVAARVGDVNNAVAATRFLNVLGIGRYNATQPTLTDGRFNALQFSSRGELLVSPGVSNFAVQAVQSGTWNVATVTSLSQFAGNAINLGAGSVGPGTLRITQASDSPLVAAIGAPADAAWVSGNGTSIAILKTIATNSSTGTAATGTGVPASAIYIGMNVGGNLTGVPGTANGLKVDGSAVTQPSSVVAATIGGATPTVIIAANSNNSTSLKGSAGTVYGVQTGNINASTPYYLKLYDKATAPTCGTDTPVAVFLIPPSNSGNNPPIFIGKAFSLGIGYCIVTGIANNDNTPVPAGTVIANIDYK